MYTFIFIVFGLIVGSFLNAVIFRLHSGESFSKGRSKCPHCKTVLGPVDLVPVLSFLWLRGRCRYCNAKISWQYPLIEAACALMFVLFGYYNDFSLNLDLVRMLIFGSVFILIGVYDFKHFLILDKVVFPALALAIIFAVFLDVQNGCSLVSINCYTMGGIVAGLLTSGFFFLQYIISSGRWIGFGDVKLGLLLGMVAGWPEFLALLFVAYLLGAAVGLGVVALGKKQMSSQMPFGSFLAVSAIITMVYGTRLVDWYLHLIGFQ